MWVVFFIAKRKGMTMNSKFRKFLQIACVFAAIFVSIGTTYPIYANDKSNTDFLPKALGSYENLMSKGYLEEQVYLSDTMIKLVKERQSFYQKYFIEGLHSDLVRIESKFDLTTIETKSSGEIEVTEIVNLTGIPILQIAKDYPPYQAAQLALKEVEGKDQVLALLLEAYASDILDGVQQSIDEGEFTISIVNKHTMSVDFEKGIVLTDYFSSESLDDPGTDKVVLFEGKPKRIEPDYLLMPDNIMYVTPIEELANTLLNDLSASSGAFTVSTVPLGSKSYSGSTAAVYIRSWVRNTTVTCYDGTLQNTLFYNPAYYPFPCTDCVNYVSQALYYGGIPTTGTWYPYSDAWIWVSIFQSYIISNDLGYFTSASLLGLGDLGIIPNTHVGMVSALNPMRYSCHTNDRLNYPWTTQYTYCINMY
ncbi:MAG TPA: hypothetical protein DF984_02720 [Anaerolineaceae bacterium]|jgi:hypothetical protein|nr:hypothetical protein [Anaerolineaceae bacterium]